MNHPKELLAKLERIGRTLEELTVEFREALVEIRNLHSPGSESPSESDDFDGADALILPDTETPAPPSGSLKLSIGAAQAAAGESEPSPSGASSAKGGLGLKIAGTSPQPATQSTVTPKTDDSGKSLCKKIAAAAGTIEDNGLAVSPKSLKFLKDAPKNYGMVESGKIDAAKAESLWKELVKRIDMIRLDLRLPGFDDFQAALETLQDEISDYYSAVYAKELKHRKISPLPNDFPQGFKGKLMQMIVEAMVKLTRGAKEPAKNIKHRRSMQELLEKVAGLEESVNLENALGIQVATAFHKTNLECGRLDTSLKEIKELLATRGIREMPVTIGDDFGDAYSPKKYRRKKVSSSAPANQILWVVQPGFTKDGVMVQEAIVAIPE